MVEVILAALLKVASWENDNTFFKRARKGGGGRVLVCIAPPPWGGGRVTLVHAATPYKRFSALLVFSTTLSREPRPTGRDAARTGA